MSTSSHKSVQIRQHTDKKILSKAQKQFNTLSKRIEQQKQLLQEWQTQIPVLQQKATVEYIPLYEDYSQLQLELVKVLDSAYDDALFKKTDKNKLRVRAGCAGLSAFAQCALWRQAGLVREDRCALACSGRRHCKGRPVSRHHDCHRAHLRIYQAQGAL